MTVMISQVDLPFSTVADLSTSMITDLRSRYGAKTSAPGEKLTTPARHLDAGPRLG